MTELAATRPAAGRLSGRVRLFRSMAANAIGRAGVALALLCMGLLAVPPAFAAGGPLGIDHRLAYDNSGIWKLGVQEKLVDGVVLANVAGALWEGGDDPVGKTFWQSIDAMAIAGGSAYVLKRVFRRERPSQTTDPDKFFQGCCNNVSFPSGDVSILTASVTPFVLEYAPQHPWVYALEALPAYEMVARLKVRKHWQTDVLAGYAIGFLSGLYAHERRFPLVLSVMPQAIYVGLKVDF